MLLQRWWLATTRSKPLQLFMLITAIVRRGTANERYKSVGHFNLNRTRDHSYPPPRLDETSSQEIYCILSLNLSLGIADRRLQTLTHITACFEARKTTRDPRRLSRLLFILLLKLFFCSICIPFLHWISPLVSCLERRSSPDVSLRRFQGIFTVQRLSSERPPEIEFFVTLLALNS